MLSWVSWNGKLLWPVVLPKYVPSANLLFFSGVGRIRRACRGEQNSNVFLGLFGFLRRWHLNRAKKSGEWVDHGSSILTADERRISGEKTLCHMG